MIASFPGAFIDQKVGHLSVYLTMTIWQYEIIFVVNHLDNVPFAKLGEGFFQFKNLMNGNVSENHPLQMVDQVEDKLKWCRTFFDGIIAAIEVTYPDSNTSLIQP